MLQSMTEPLLYIEQKHLLDPVKDLHNIPTVTIAFQHISNSSYKKPSTSQTSNGAVYVQSKLQLQLSKRAHIEDMHAYKGHAYITWALCCAIVQGKETKPALTTKTSSRSGRQKYMSILHLKNCCSSS